MSEAATIRAWCFGKRCHGVTEQELLPPHWAYCRRRRERRRWYYRYACVCGRRRDHEPLVNLRRIEAA